MQDWVFVHEDDWGRHTLEVRENIVERTQTAAEVRDFAETHRAPNGLGWTDIAVVPAAAIPLTVRRLTLAALREVLGPGVQQLGGVRCGYGNATEPVVNGFAFACARVAGRDPTDDWNILYGIAKDEQVVQLHLTFGTPAIAPLLHRLGTTFGLILFSGHDVVDLAVRAAIDHFLDDNT